LTIGIEGRKKEGALNFYLLPGRQYSLGGNLYIVILLEGYPDQVLEYRILKNLKPFQVPERDVDGLGGDARPFATISRRDRIIRPLIVGAHHAAPDREE
jgi:hypothetical protein